MESKEQSPEVSDSIRNVLGEDPAEHFSHMYNLENFQYKIEDGHINLDAQS